MGQVFLTVYDEKRRPVAAKTLVDAAGNDVINPRTGQPLIVPRDYDINAAVDFGRSLRHLPRLPFSEDPAGPSSMSRYEAMYKAFQHGGAHDLQRSYNGMVGGGGDEFVRAFKDAASFNLGIVGRAAELSPDEIVLGGGMYNLRNRLRDFGIDVSGPMFNNPDNFRMIQEGISGHDSSRFLKRTPSNEQFDDAVQRSVTRGNLPESRLADQATLQFTSPGQAVELGRMAHASGLPQHVIDTGNYLRANGYEITPRTMYVSHVLGPQAAVDLFKRTGSTASDAVPTADAATGDRWAPGCGRCGSARRRPVSPAPWRPRPLPHMPCPTSRTTTRLPRSSRSPEDRSGLRAR